MVRRFAFLTLVVGLFNPTPSFGQAPPPSSYDKIPAYKNLTPSEYVGKEIWYKATRAVRAARLASRPLGRRPFGPEVDGSSMGCTPARDNCQYGSHRPARLIRLRH